MQPIIDWLIETVGQIGYPGIFLLMALESSFFPFPSEVVMIPAGYLAYQSEMNIYAVVAAGIAGSLAGALFNYYLAMHIGRPLLLRWGHYVLLSESTLERMENYFRVHGPISTFNGRLIPGIRQYISLPAGLARMSVGRFCLYTSLGAGIWVLILTLLGFLLGSQQELLAANLHRITIGAVVFVVVSSVVYFLIYRRRRVR